MTWRGCGTTWFGLPRVGAIDGNRRLITYDGHFRHLAQTVIYGSI